MQAVNFFQAIKPELQISAVRRRGGVVGRKAIKTSTSYR